MNFRQPLTVLVAEDDDTDILLLKRALHAAGVENEVRFVFDGEDVVSFFTEAVKNPQCRLPGLVILDLKMPRMGGLETLQWMRAQPVVQNIPAVIFSSSANLREIDEAYASGANAYLVKPPSLSERADIVRFLKDWLTLVRPPSSAAESVRAAQSERLA